jgi:hypothetical protein
MSEAAELALVCAIAWEFPQLLGHLEEHLQDNAGEVIPHVLMGEYERWAESLAHDRHLDLERLFRMLEQAYESGDEDVRNLIEVSFVEQLPYPDEANAAIRDFVGPALGSLLQHGV